MHEQYRIHSCDEQALTTVDREVASQPVKRLDQLLAFVSIVYAFLISLLQDEGALLRVWLLDRWDHQTGKRAPQIRDRVLWLVPELELCCIWHQMHVSTPSVSVGDREPNQSGKQF